MAPGDVDHSVHIGQVDVVRESLNEVADIDYEGILDGSTLYPIAIAIHDLKTTDVVLRQNGQISVVRMGTNTDDIFCDATMLRRVV
jgi:hypothetical protein